MNRATAAPVSFNWQLGLLVSVVFGAYLHWITARYSFDAVAYCSLIHYALFEGVPAVLVHPFHMLYSPMGYATASSLMALGFEVDVLALMQLLNACATAAALWVFAGVLKRATGDSGLALAVTAVLGVSFVLWFYATNPEVYPFSLLCLVLAYRACLASLDTSALLPVLAAGAWVGIGIGFHVSAILIVPGVVAALLLGSRDLATGRRVVRSAAMLTVAGVLALAPFVIHYRWGQDTRALPAMERIFFAEIEDRSSFGDHFRPDIEAHAILRGLVAEPEIASPALRGSVKVGRLALVAAVIVVLARARRTWRTYRWTFGIAAGWALLSFAFYSWYLVGGQKFVAFQLVPLLMVVGLAFSTLPTRRWVTATVVVWAVVVGASNLLGVIRPFADPLRNPHLCETNFIRSHTAENDLVIYLGYGDSIMQRVYLPYFGQRHGLAMTDLFDGSKRSAVEGVRLLGHTIHASRLAGGRAIVLSEVLDDHDLVRRFEGWRSLPGGLVGRAVRAFGPMPLVSGEDGVVLYVLSGDPGFAESGR